MSEQEIPNIAIPHEGQVKPPTRAEWEAMFPNLSGERTKITLDFREKVVTWAKDTFKQVTENPIYMGHEEDIKAFDNYKLHAFYVGMYVGLSITLGEDIDVSMANLKEILGGAR